MKYWPCVSLFVVQEKQKLQLQLHFQHALFCVPYHTVPFRRLSLGTWGNTKLRHTALFAPHDAYI
jgi:hypothetical protein